MQKIVGMTMEEGFKIGSHVFELYDPLSRIKDSKDIAMLVKKMNSYKIIMNSIC